MSSRNLLTPPSLLLARRARPVPHAPPLGLAQRRVPGVVDLVVPRPELALPAEDGPVREDLDDVGRLHHGHGRRRAVPMRLVLLAAGAAGGGPDVRAAVGLDGLPPR